MGRIAYVGCYICSREFASRSIASHEKKCLERWRRINKALPPNKRCSTPVKREDSATWTCDNCCQLLPTEEKEQHRSDCVEKVPQEKLTLANRSKAQQNPKSKLTRMIERIKPVVPRVKVHSCIHHNRPNSGIRFYGPRHMRAKSKLLNGANPNLPHGENLKDSNGNGNENINGAQNQKPKVNGENGNCSGDEENSNADETKRLNGSTEQEVSECEERLRTAGFLNGEEAKVENAENSWLIVQAQLSKCPNCNRTFFPERLPIHKRVCKAKPAPSAQSESVQEEKRPRSVFKQPMGTCYICGRQFRETILTKHQEKCLESWRYANKNLPEDLQRPEPMLPEVILKDDGTVDKDAMTEAAWKTYLNQLVQCSRCSRKFLPDRLLAHTHNCKATPLENLHKNKSMKTLKAQDSG